MGAQQGGRDLLGGGAGAVAARRGVRRDQEKEGQAGQAGHRQQDAVAPHPQLGVPSPLQRPSGTLGSHIMELSKRLETAPNRAMHVWVRSPIQPRRRYGVSCADMLSLTEFGLVRRTSVRFCQISPEFGQLWLVIGRFVCEFCKHCPSSAEVGQSWPGFGKLWSRFGQSMSIGRIKSDSVRYRPILPNLAEVHRIWAN